MAQSEIKPCHACGEPMHQANERACGVCTACVQKSHVQPGVIPAPRYGQRASG